MKKFLLLSVLLLSTITAGAQYVFVTSYPGQAGEIRVGKSLDLGAYQSGGSFVADVLPGETVYFDFRPFIGYRFIELTYDDNLSSDDVTMLPGEIYSFTMPVYRDQLMIMIQVHFEEIPGEYSGVDVTEENFPDPNFRNWLLSQSFCINGVIPDVGAVNKITARGCGIQDLTGIEYFPGLIELDVSNSEFMHPEEQWNRISTIDLSGNPLLRKIWVDNNLLTSIDVSDCQDLRHLQVTNNLLTQLDVTHNTALSLLYCDGNQLTGLDLSQNPDLGVMACFGNQLTSLDVSNNLSLEQLYCEFNQLTTLDVTNHNKLMILNCNNNQLTSLDLAGCSELFQLYFYNNRIKVQEMENVVNSLPERPAYLVVVDLDNEYEQNEMTASQVAIARAKGWSVEGISGEDFYPYDGIGGGTDLLGDVDKDGNVGIADVTALINYLLSGDASNINLAVSDVDDDGLIGIADVTAIIDYILSGTW